MSKFKVGDKVKLIYASSFKVEGVVGEISKFNDHTIWDCVIDFGEVGKYYCSTDNLEKAG